MIRQTLTLLVFLLACSLAAQTTDADILEFARVANRENRVEEAIKFLEIPFVNTVILTFLHRGWAFFLNTN